VGRRLRSNVAERCEAARTAPWQCPSDQGNNGEISKSNSGSCPKEEHALKFVSAAKGSCDTDFTFNVKQKDGKTALKYPGQLKHKLKFADAANGYINFTPLANGDIKIDPTYGLNPDGTTSTGTCTAACTKVSRGRCQAWREPLAAHGLGPTKDLVSPLFSVKFDRRVARSSGGRRGDRGVTLPPVAQYAAGAAT
jgi:hypothetical protein